MPATPSLPSVTDRPVWPGPIRTLRGVLPAEMRLLRGVLGLVGGLTVFATVVVLIVGGSWHLGFGDDRALVGIFGLLIPAAIGVASPVWYWCGRPVWATLGRPGTSLVEWPGGGRFLAGLAGPVFGAGLVLPVRATSGWLVQTLAPFGIAIGIAGPLWYWVGRPLLGDRIRSRMPGVASSEGVKAAVLRTLPALLSLFLASAVLTAVIGLPIVGLGDPIRTDGLSTTVSTVQTVQTIDDTDGGYGFGENGPGFVLIEVTVTNDGDTTHRLPGRSVGDIALIGPTCGTQTFGEPTNNCNQVYLDGPFSAAGTTYASYDERLRAAGGRIAPGERVRGWLAFRLENEPSSAPTVVPMVIVDDVGRWTLGDL